MADIKTEIQSIYDAILPVINGATPYFQDMPDEYRPNEVAIELSQSRNATETAATYRLDRLYQIVYFGTDGLDCVEKMEAIERIFNDKQMIKLGDEARYLRIGSFSVSAAFKTESGPYACLGMLEAELREMRSQEQSDKIENIIVEISPVSPVSPDVEDVGEGGAGEEEEAPVPTGTPCNKNKGVIR